MDLSCVYFYPSRTQRFPCSCCAMCASSVIRMASGPWRCALRKPLQKLCPSTSHTPSSTSLLMWVGAGTHGILYNMFCEWQVTVLLCHLVHTRQVTIPLCHLVHTQYVLAHMLSHNNSNLWYLLMENTAFMNYFKYQHWNIVFCHLWCLNPSKTSWFK